MRPRYALGLLAFLLTFSVFWAQEKNKPEEKKSPPAPAAAVAAPQGPHKFKISEEQKARKNPIKFTVTSVEKGSKLYLSQCAMCHGLKADGKGEAAIELEISPPDFTKPDTLKPRTDGELFGIIDVGSEKMPGQAKRMTERHKWHIVNYLRAAGGKTPEKDSTKEPEEDVILVPQP